MCLWVLLDTAHNPPSCCLCFLLSLTQVLVPCAPTCGCLLLCFFINLSFVFPHPLVKTQVLDPEQNAAFVDTYLGLPFDLSSALFVATANRASDIPPPLLDRLEVVQLGGYTQEEKVGVLLHQGRGMS